MHEGGGGGGASKLKMQNNSKRVTNSHIEVAIM